MLVNYFRRLLANSGLAFRNRAPSASESSNVRTVRAEDWFNPPMLTAEQREIADRFIDMAYCISDTRNRRSYICHWLGFEMLKWPTDLWIYQELVCRIQPDLIIETGTHKGGSALYLANICDLLGNGRIITVDLDATWQPARPVHPRITYLTGSSTAPDVVAHMTEANRSARTTLVILDSDHRMPHVLDEMRLYSSLVSRGSYLIVEDTIVNGHPSYKDFGPGPFEAVTAFVKECADFEIDPTCERLYFSQNPRGFLRRK